MSSAGQADHLGFAMRLALKRWPCDVAWAALVMLSQVTVGAIARVDKRLRRLTCLLLHRPYSSPGDSCTRHVAVA